MNGGLAVLYQSKQVGGLYDWQIDITPNSTIRGGWYEYKITKEISARSYWLTDVPAGNCFEVKFYKTMQGQLVLVDSGKIEVDLPDKTLGRRLRISPEIRWIC